MINLIVCVDNKYGIGKNNKIPWHYSKDLKMFKEYTTQPDSTAPNKKNIVIMGNKTKKSIKMPLKNRINIVLSKQKHTNTDDTLYFNNIIQVLYYLEENKKTINKAWVIGGSEIYKEFLEMQIIDKIYLTMIPNKDYKCDTYFDKEYLKRFNMIEENIEYDYDKESGELQRNKLQFMIYKYYNKEENKYLETIKKILETGEEREDRTGVGTISKFGKSFKYNIRNYRLPLFTHRQMFYRGIIEELLFFISGKTDTKILENKKVNIWKGNTSREFLDSRELYNLKEGDMGAGYSFQLRHYGAEYKTAEEDYINKGFDQLKYVIDLIKRDPYSRRILFSYWNPNDLDKVALPSCFVKDTQVLTKYGYMPIQNINLNDLVYTHLGNWKPVHRINKRQYKGTMYQIECEDNDKIINVTSEHPFLVKDTKSDITYWCKAEDLHLNHLFCMPINKKKEIKVLTDNEGFTKEISLNDCYFLGYYLLNGYYDNENEYYMEIRREDLPKLKDFHYYLNKINDNKHKIQNFQYYEILNEFGYKKYNKKIPEWIIDLPKEYLRFFINGFSNRLMHFNIYSKTLAYSIQRIYAKLNIYCGIKYNNNARVSYELKIYEKNDLIDRDYQYFKIQKILSKEINNNSIVVYNLEVETDNSYIVNNIITHNCHILYQFYVNKLKNELSCSFYQRSSDFVLAADFNIVSASILTFMLCKMLDYKPGKVIHNIGDIHIYKSHIEETKKMLNDNKMYNFPIIDINKRDNIEDYVVEDFKILLYQSNKKYNFKMSI